MPWPGWPPNQPPGQGTGPRRRREPDWPIRDPGRGGGPQNGGIRLLYGGIAGSPRPAFRGGDRAWCRPFLPADSSGRGRGHIRKEAGIRMSQQVQVTLICDMPPHETDSPADRTVTLGIDGRHYELEVCARHELQLLQTLGRYTMVARRVPLAGMRRNGLRTSQ